MQFFNSLTNTDPIALHFQSSHGKNTIYTADIIKEVISSTKLEKPYNCTLLTFATPNIIETAVLLQQLNKNKIEYINLCDIYEYGEWDNTLKVKLLHKYLQDNNVLTDYLVILDSIDVLLSSNFSKLIEEFKKFNVDILYGSTSNNHPKGTLTDFEPQEREPFRYTNCGTVVAKTAEFTKFIEHCYNNQYTETNKLKSEQYIIRKNLNSGNKDKFRVEYDHKGKLFLTTNFFYTDYYNFFYSTYKKDGVKTLELIPHGTIMEENKLI